MPVDAPKGGKGFLKAKVGPVPVPLLLAAVVAVGVYIYVKRRGAQASTSAGSNATPSGTDLTGYPQGDSTGGGAGGIDLSSLFDALAGNAQAQAALAGTNTPYDFTGLTDAITGLQGQLANPVPLEVTIAPGGGPVVPAGGGNTVSTTTATQPSAPATSTLLSGNFTLPALKETTSEWADYPTLNLSNAKAGDVVKVSNVTIPKKVSGSTQYYTYKKDVPKGSTVKFTPGAGYYAG